MLPFRVQLRPGLPIHEQVVDAAKKALLSGRLRTGEPFPSIRTLSRELRINPNAASRVVSTLIFERFLETKPGVGTIVASLAPSDSSQRKALLHRDIEHLIMEAQNVGISLKELQEAVESNWQGSVPPAAGGHKRS